MQEVVERLLPIARREPKLCQEQQFPIGIGGPADKLSKVGCRLLSPLRSSEQAGKLRPAAEVLRVEAHRLAQRRNRLRGGLRVISRPQAPEIHGAEDPVGGGGLWIPRYGLGRGCLCSVEIESRQIEIGDGDERFGRLQVEFRRPPVGSDGFFPPSGHLGEPPFAVHPIGLGDRIDSDRFFGVFFGVAGLLGLRTGGTGFLSSGRRARRRPEEHQQNPEDRTRHGTGIYRCEETDRRVTCRRRLIRRPQEPVQHREAKHG